MHSSEKRFVSLLLLAATVPFWSLGCAKSPQAQKGAEVQPYAITTNSPTPASAQTTVTPADKKLAPAPTKDEISQVIARVFDKAAALDDSHAPSFVVGDFNGDGSEDLAVAIKADERSLGEINNELANWTLEDAKAVPVPGTKAAEQLLPRKPVKAAKGDSLLAIIHGAGALGWRNGEARQTFLLRNGVGTDVTVQPANKIFATAKSKSLPTKGDVIAEKLAGHAGVIFWTGAMYSWYSPPEMAR